MERRTILRKWMDKHERGTGWVARQAGRSKQWISYVINGHKLFSDEPACTLHETFGFQFYDLPKAECSTKRTRSPAKVAE
jgi:hypothetical protein